jgi:hypothetical protein
MFSGPFFQEIAKRKEQGKDAKIIISAVDAQTGVGKSALAVALAIALDTSSNGGFDAERKATLDVERFLGLYDELEPGSAMILDEAEQIDSRRSMSNKNIDAAFRWQTRRVNEIIAILTLPSIDMIDCRMERLMDYRIDVTARGSAKVYKKKIHPMQKNIYYRKLQIIRWPNMDGHPDYTTLATMKDEMISKPDSDDWIRRDEHESKLEKATQMAGTETRDRIIQQLADAGVPNQDIAAGVGLSPGRVSQIKG